MKAALLVKQPGSMHYSKGKTMTAQELETKRVTLRILVQNLSAIEDFDGPYQEAIQSLHDAISVVCSQIA
jgi:hypothetical protein